MKKGLVVILLGITFTVCGIMPLRAETPPDAKEIVRKMDRLYRSNTSQGKVEMDIVSPHWKRSLRMDVWSQGMDKTFIHITYPKKDADIATLRMGNEMWNYFPKIDKIMKVPPSMMMSSWMGSDFTNDDLVKESSMLEDYNFKLIPSEDAQPGLYYVELRPKENTAIVWDRIVLMVRKQDYLPVREDYYDEKGRKVRTLEFKDIKDLGGRKIPATLELTPLTEEGKKTVIRYLQMEFDIPLNPGIFTLRNLQKKR
jgi:outer membrane lipoprotein-sorting protein